MIVALLLWLVSVQGDAAEVTRELTRIEEQLAATWKRGDCDAWGALLAPDWSVIHITGNVITKAKALEMCTALRKLSVTIETVEIGDLSVRVFGESAVVTGRTTYATSGADAVTMTLRFTDVFVRRAGRWEVVASHATRLPD
jgi:ketosteroid isomerase-like protein